MREIARVFLKLGFLGFGGPLATISMMEDETVKKRHWISEEVFAKGYALIKVFPGPTATQMAVHLGRLRAGRWGGLLAGLCFVLPTFFIILGLGLGLQRIGEPWWKDFFLRGMQVAALAVIFQGIYRLSRANLKRDGTLGIVAVSFLVVIFYSQAEPLLILFFGILGIGMAVGIAGKKYEFGTLMWLVFVCLKAALLTFGTGLAIIPLLEPDVVGTFHWMNHWEFMHALALGQITPGPVVITVTWIGFKVAGILGAVLATVAVFAPGFLMSLFAVPMIHDRWGGTRAIEGFYRLVIPTVIGAMAASFVILFAKTVIDPVGYGIFGAALFLLFKRNTPSWVVIPMFGAISILLNKLVW